MAHCSTHTHSPWRSALPLLRLHYEYSLSGKYTAPNMYAGSVLDLQPNYDAEFLIDGIAIPRDQVDSILATGRHQFEPGPGKAIERWSPGDHTVVATYISPNQLDVGTVVWTFRVQ